MGLSKTSTAAILLVFVFASSVAATRPVFIQSSRNIVRTSTSSIPQKHYTDILAQLHSFSKLVSSQAQVEEVVQQADIFQQFIDEQRSAVLSESAEHAAIKATQDEQCQDELPFREKEISDAQNAYSRSQQALSSCTANLASAQGILKLNKDAQDVLNERLEALAKQRKIEREVFEIDNFTYYNATLQVKIALQQLDTFRVALNADLGAQALAMITKHTNVIFKHAVKLGATSLLTLASRALIKMTTKEVDADDLTNIETLFNHILERLQFTWDKIVEAELEAIRKYEAEKSRLEAILTVLKEEQTKVENHILEMTACIDTERSISGDASNKESRNKDLLEKAKVLCGTYQEQYAAAQATRANMLKMINALETSINYLKQKYPAKFVSLNRALKTGNETLTAEIAAGNDVTAVHSYNYETNQGFVSTPVQTENIY